jgi:multiple sugar transport system substrate-binding protein
MTRRGAALGVLLVALAGCAPQATTHRTTVTFWAMGHEGEVVRELADRFERENPGIHIEVQTIPWSAAHEKLLTAHVGRSLPDASQLGNTWVPEFEALKALAPLDARVAASPDMPRSAFFEGIWNTNVVNGQTWGIPWYVDTRVLFYRKDVLQRAGWDSIPGDWASWRRAMADVKRTLGPGHTAIFLPINEWTVPIVLGLSTGSPLLKDHDTRGAFAEPEFKKAFDFYVSLFRDGLAAPVANNEISNLYQEFAGASFTMYVTGPWNLDEFKNRMPDSLKNAWATAPMPGPTGQASGYSTAGGSSLVLFAASKHQAEAWKWIEFLSLPASQARFFHLAGDLPARREAWADSALAFDPRIQAFRSQLDRVRPAPPVPEIEQIMALVQDEAEAAVRGAVPPDSALAALDRAVDRLLEKRRWLASRGMLH